MFWSNRKKKIFIIVGIPILCIIFFLAIYYYFNPIKKEFDISATGCLLFKTEQGSEIVDVEIKVKTFRYIFHNQADAIQGNVWINGYGIFGNGLNNFGFYERFYQDSNYSCVNICAENYLGTMVTVSKAGNTMVCAVNVNSYVSSKSDMQANTQALLVIPAKSYDTASTILNDVASNSQQLESWLVENKWESILE